MLTGQNGILNRASEAKENTSISQTEETVKVAVMEALTQGTGKITDANLRTALNNTVGEGKYTITGDETNGWTVTVNGKSYTISGTGAVTIAGSNPDETPTNPGEKPTEPDPTPEVPEGLGIGSIVTYSPSGTYTWEGKYCSSSQSDVTLSSASGDNFNLSEWKVLSIENGKVELVPIAPTVGEVYLGQAQGYNNGVKLLNDACSSLYRKWG